MLLTVVGSSPAWPNPGSAHSGYLVETAGDRLLLDCGPGVLARLREREPWPNIDAIVITHFHADHCGGLVPWLWGQLMGPAAGERRPALHLPPGGRGRLAELARPEQWDAAFAIAEYAEREPFDAAGHTVTPYRVVHYDEPTWGLRVERDGAVLAYSADTAPAPAVTELARDANVFLCEATLTGPDSEPRGHMHPDEARAIAREAGARQLLLTHRGAEHPEPELVRDGLTVEISARG